MGKKEGKLNNEPSLNESNEVSSRTMRVLAYKTCSKANDQNYKMKFISVEKFLIDNEK